MKKIRFNPTAQVAFASATLMLLLGACGNSSTPSATTSTSQTSQQPVASTPTTPIDNSVKGWRSYYYTEDNQVVPVPVSLTQDTTKPAWSFDSAGLKGHTLSATWAARLSPTESGTYTFDINGVTNPLFYIDGKPVKSNSQSIDLTAGKQYWIQVSANDIPATGDMHISWKKTGASFAEIPMNLLDTYQKQKTGAKAQSLGLNEPINLNPGFEDGLKDWIVSTQSPDIFTVVQPGYNSTNALQVKANSANALADVMWWPKDYDNVIPGAKYRLELQYKTDNAYQCYLGSDAPTSIYKQVGEFTTVTREFILAPNALSLPLPSVFNDGFAGKSLRLGIVGNAGSSCTFDDAKITRIADPVPVEPAANLLKNGTMEPDPQNPNFPASWTQAQGTPIHPETDVNLVPSGVPNSGTAVSFGRLKQTISAQYLKPNTEYALRFDMKGYQSGVCQVSLRDGEKWLYNLDGRDQYNYKDIYGIYKTGSTVSDIDVVLKGRNCTLDNIRFGPVNASDIVKNETLEKLTGELGQNGGSLESNGVKVSASPGELMDNYVIGIQTYKEDLSAITSSVEFLNAFHITINGKNGLFTSLIEFKVNGEGDNDHLYELYEQENNNYKLIGFNRDSNWIEIYPDLPIQGELNLDKKYVLVREKISDLESGFASTGGEFNGLYGECPSDMRALFGKCVKRSSTISPLQIIDNPVILLSVNAGNISGACKIYNYKLCSINIENILREDIIQSNSPDLISIQEVFPEGCQDPNGVPIKDERKGDTYICGKIRPKRTQLERLIGHKDSQGLYNMVSSNGTVKKFIVECSPHNDGAYECIAINSEKFVIDIPSKPVQYLSGNSYKTSDYCPDDDTHGRDTGFFAKSIKVLNGLGKQNVTFDFVDAHLATPGNSGNTKCRRQQLDALKDAFKGSGRKMLIAGDFNINYKSYLPYEDQATLMAITSSFDTPIDSPPNLKLGYMISDQNQFTTIFGKGLDHVISNFSDTKESSICRRVGTNSLMIDHLSTTCPLYGFDTGQAVGLFQVLDTETGEFSNVVPVVSVRRKGIVVPGSKWTLNIPTSVTLPSNLNTYVEFSLNCPTSLPIGKNIMTFAGGSVSGGKFTTSAYRSWCPW